MSETRRSFLKQSVATVAAASVAGCAPGASRDSSDRPESAAGAGSAGASAMPLPGETLRAVAEAVLPAELGDRGRERAVAAFERWSDGLEPVAELAHPYLVPETRYSGPDPRPGWVAQLEGLEKECASRHGVSLSAIDMPVRRELLARPLGQAGPGMGSPANASHVAAALMSHFFASPVATDLCYRRGIGKQQCRGLDGAAAEPAALGDAP
ncbi:MAG: hypothetical protein OXE96_02165 [Gemmatimonadetes bacterium]|nr:hypothetical protein [Gemmatimonadota bacterium]